MFIFCRKVDNVYHNIPILGKLEMRHPTKRWERSGKGKGHQRMWGRQWWWWWCWVFMCRTTKVHSKAVYRAPRGGSCTRSSDLPKSCWDGRVLAFARLNKHDFMIIFNNLTSYSKILKMLHWKVKVILYLKPNAFHWPVKQGFRDQLNYFTTRRLCYVSRRL